MRSIRVPPFLTTAVAAAREIEEGMIGEGVDLAGQA
jgi:hypothetical protein